MGDREGAFEEPHRWTRDEVTWTIGATIIDASQQFPPFPLVPSELAWSVAEEICARLRALDVLEEPSLE